jgi:acetyl-CoA carboxylase biotin carboxyl carrier protein
MEYKDLINLIKTINKSELSEFKMKDGDFELVIRTDKYSKARKEVIQTSQPMVQVPPPTVVSQQSEGSGQQSEKSAPEQAPPKEEKDVPSASSPDSGADDMEGLVPIKSPIVGTFYRASAPDKPPYIKVGDQVDEGSVVCIVETMKLFNEIESEVSGKIVKVMVEDASPVEYDQVLFMVDPS